MRKPSSAWLIVCLVVVSATAPVVAQQPAADPSVDDLTYTGDGAVSGSNETLFLWNGSAHEFTATVSTNGSFDGEVCLVSVPSESNRTRGLACSGASTQDNDSTTRASVSVGAWPDNATGQQEVQALLQSANATRTIDQASLTVIVVRRGGDYDGDGLSNEREATLGTDLRAADTDGDGLSDGEEVRTHETSPTNPDTDDDGLSDHAERQTHGTDPTTADTDDDGLPDEKELRLDANPTKADSDGDGLEDGAEVNVHETDPTDPDSDDDGLADGKEVDEHGTSPTNADTDDDGLSDALEVDNYRTDPSSVDTDGDGLDDGAEVNQFQTDPADADTDDDGLADGQEVKTFATSPTDPDSDGDGLEDGPEVYEYETNPNEADSDDDGQPDGAEVEQGLFSKLGGPAVVLGGVGFAFVLVVGLGFLHRSDGGVRIPGIDERLRAAIVTLQFDPDRGPGDGGPDAGAAGVEADPAGDGAPDDAPGAVDVETPDDVPPEFMTNEQRVLGLLDEHGGRMDQSDVVDETGWSKSKVSRVLSEMEADDQIVKIDVGAGNVVAVPEHVPPGVQSPLDD